MSIRDVSFREISLSVFLALLTICTFFVQFIFRSVDDNRLTSWKWAFRDADVNMVLLFLVCALGIAYVFSRLSLPESFRPFFLFIFSFAMSSVFWQEPEVLVDTSRYFTQAKHLEVYGIRYFLKEWGKAIHAWTDLPLVPFLYGLVFKFFGESRVCVQVFNSLVFSSTAVITYGIGKTLWDEDTGFHGGLLLLGIPYLMTQVPLMLVDVPTMFFFTLSVYTFLMAMERGKASVILSSLSLFLAFFSKYSTWLMLSLLGMIFLIYLAEQKGRRKKILQRGVVVAYFSGILIGVVMLLKFEVFSDQIQLLLSYQKPGLKRWGESYVSTFFYQTQPFLTASAMFSLLFALKKRDLRYIIISWSLILFLVLNIQRARYTIIIFPMIALMASYGLQKIQGVHLRRFIVYSCICSALVTGIVVYLPFLQSSGLVNLMRAGSFLDSLEEPEFDVVTLSSENATVNPAVSVPMLDFFTDKKISYQYDSSGLPPFEMREKSSVRFTWEYRNPGYYTHGGAGEGPVSIVLIRGVDTQEIPAQMERKLRRYSQEGAFQRSSGIFGFEPQVFVYRLL